MRRYVRFVAEPAIVKFDVAIVDRLNNPVLRSGIEVSMSQVLYSSEGLFPGLASTNGMPEGQSPVTALTDVNGVAHFEVRAVQQQPHEIFFQAWLQEPFPHGYSSAVAVHFLVDPPLDPPHAIREIPRPEPAWSRPGDIAAGLGPSSGTDSRTSTRLRVAPDGSSTSCRYGGGRPSR